MEKVKLGPEPLLYPMPAVLVGAVVDGKPNYMTAAWCGIAAAKPPSIAVAIRPQRYTLQGITEHNTFSINVPPAKLAQEVDYCGIYSGRQKDKSRLFETFYGSLKTAPMIEQCPVNLECRVSHTLKLGSHTLVVGEIIETYIDENCQTNGNVDPARIDPLVYSTSATQYQRLGEVIGKAFQIGKKL